MQLATTGRFKLFNASSYRLAIIVAQFNRSITEAMLKTALRKAEAYGIKRSRIAIFRVAGCVEIPAVLMALVEAGIYDCALAIGAVIRGETDHYKYVADIVTKGVLETIEEGLPVGFGVLTVDSLEQAKARVPTAASSLEAVLQATKVIQRIKGLK